MSPESLEAWHMNLIDLAFLTGDWRANEDDGSYWLESWQEPVAGTLLGTARWIGDEGVRLYELMVVEEVEGELWYRMLHYRPGLAVSEKDGPMVYRVVELSERGVVFEDPEREFPRRLVYVREDDRLRFRFEGVKEGEPTTIAMDFAMR